MMKKRGCAGILALAAVLVVSGQVDSDARGAVGGGAFGVAAVVAPVVTLSPQPIVQIGGGGGAEFDGLETGVSPPLLVQAVKVTIFGFPSEEPDGILARATADVGRVVVGDPLAPTVEILGAHSDCLWTNRGSTGSASVAGIRVNGAPLPDLASAPNTAYDLGAVRLVLNAQRRSTLPDGSRVIIVDAVRLEIASPLGPTEVVVAESACDPVNFPTFSHQIGTVIGNVLPGNPQ
jgi:hypothetical protein